MNISKYMPYLVLVIGAAIAIAASQTPDIEASLIGMGTGLIAIILSAMWTDMKENKT